MKALALLGLVGLTTGSPAGSTPRLIDAVSVVPDLRAEQRYATSGNLLGRPVSRETRCLLRPEAARALRRGQALVERQGFRLVAWDCYRPRSVQELLWEKQPTPGLVANPKRGSNHTRGVAVDVTLARADGGPVEMPTDFDDLSPRAASGATQGVSPAAQANRAVLRRAMLAAGFTGIRREWWHFDLKGALGFPVMDDQPDPSR